MIIYSDLLPPHGKVFRNLVSELQVDYVGPVGVSVHDFKSKMFTRFVILESNTERLALAPVYLLILPRFSFYFSIDFHPLVYLGKRQLVVCILNKHRNG
jgi:hypothetical protein